MKTQIKNLLLLPALMVGLGLILAGRVTAQTFTTLHNFNGEDGSDTKSGLILSGNTLCGTAEGGGRWGSGTVFGVNTNGTGFTNLYSFTGGNNGAFPSGGVILSGSILYGTTIDGGTNGLGTIFAVNTNGTVFEILHNFSGSDGEAPVAGLTLSGNTLYGVAQADTVFSINTNGTGFTNLIANGLIYDPFSALTVSGNTLYGTTAAGGFQNQGGGSVFAVNTNGTGLTNLYSFTGGNNGAAPWAGVVLSGNTLYGTTTGGGSGSSGTVFAVNTDGTGFRTLYSFTATSTNASGIYTNSDGARPFAGLILSGQTLIGTSEYGGSSGNGTVFAVNTDGTGYMNLYSFKAGNTNSSGSYTNNGGANPNAGLILSGINLYGTTQNGGTNGYGTVFSLSLALVVTTTTLPNATNGVAYNQTLTALGGQTPYSWTNSSGVLPPGLTLATDGVISGTPQTNGSLNFTVKVTDANNNMATQALALTVLGPPSVRIQPTNSSVTVTVGNNVSLSVSVTGIGPFSYQWQLDGTNLPDGIINTVAGNGAIGYFGDGGAATNASFYYPEGVAVDTTGNLFIADTDNNVIRKVETGGIITTVAGNGTGSYSGDGWVATNAKLSAPTDVAVDTTGNLFIADHFNNRIRKVGTNGIIITVAGNGSYSYFGDGGAATNAELDYPNGVAVDTTGNLFIADTDNNVIRKVGIDGIITTVAGNGSYGYFGDGGAATNAELYYPGGVAVDTTGNLFIANTDNNVICKVGTGGIITTVAGNGYGAGTGNGGFSGDGGAATNAELHYPVCVAVDTIGNLFIADAVNNVILKVGTDGIITTVAGNGYGAGTYSGGFSGDGGAATNAELNAPIGVAVDTAGNLFIADEANQRIREVVTFQGPTLVLNNVGFGNAGAYGVVVTSPYGSVTSSVVSLTITLPVILSTPQITAGKTNFTFLLSGPAGSNYVLQVSTNLLNWSPVITSTIPVSGSINLSNAINGYKQSFYRAFLK